uniref:J domain-containing protein n=1 Tax=Strombidium rassoulzadegani TaxID=1082188 RepID=A0A7S3CLN6_9SPIT|mmetsp:Transcript_13793/g.23524  ORF Transcript_13793/g.23524 Transcript_13793/m.23524 type:complete len:172 (+) Transcript_13793:1346-1861(+)
MSELGDLDFNMGQQPPSQGQASHQQEVTKSRHEEVKEYFTQEQLKRDQWDSAQQKLSLKLDQWIGVKAQSRGPQYPGFDSHFNQTNNIKVLLCTLQNVLWEGHNWQIVGMDKLADPQQVKKLHRKAIMMCHPDKVNAKSEHNADKVYIANRCFAALNLAFNEYKNEPGVRL